MTRQGKFGLVVTNAAVCSSDHAPSATSQLQIHVRSRLCLPRAGCGHQLQQDLCGSSYPFPMTAFWAICTLSLLGAGQTAGSISTATGSAGIQQQGTLLTKYLIPFLFKQTVNNLSSNRLSLVNKNQWIFFFFTHQAPLQMLGPVKRCFKNVVCMGGNAIYIGVLCFPLHPFPSASLRQKTTTPRSSSIEIAHFCLPQNICSLKYWIGSESLSRVSQAILAHCPIQSCN